MIRRRLKRRWVAGLSSRRRNLHVALPGITVLSCAMVCTASGVGESRLSDEVLPLQTNAVPDRPRPLLELGNGLLATGSIHPGFTLPTRATLQPSLIVWGTYRTALQGVDEGDDMFSEWANRLDLFGNLYLTPTERILAGFRPLDEDGRFSGHTFSAPDGDKEEEGANNEFNSELTILFFEGDFGELFPILDWKDARGLDFGLAVGRQDIRFQNGMLIDDNIDALGISKINLRTGRAVNHRATLLYAWNEINRNNRSSDDDDSALIGFFNEFDFRKSTVAFDVIYVSADEDTGDGIYGGISAIQRMGELNTTFRILGSSAMGEETDHNASGVMLYNELSRTIHGADNFVYLNSFWGIDTYRSASRGPSVGGALGPAGILYESVGLGRYGAALDACADNVIGGAMGYQAFWDGVRRQVIVELGGRYATEEVGRRAVAAGITYQAAVGQRTVFRIDSFASYDKNRELVKMRETTSNELGIGGRVELTYKF